MYGEWVNKLLHMEAHCVEAYDATHLLHRHHPSPPPIDGWMGWTGWENLPNIMTFISSVFHGMGHVINIHVVD